MSPRLADLPPAAWQPSAAGGYAAGFVASCTGGIAVEAAGWPVPDAARLVPPEGPPVHFLPAGAGGFAALPAVAAGARLVLQAPQPPARCRIAMVPHPAPSPSLALLAPRALLVPPRAPGPDLAALSARVAAALAAQALDPALAAAAEMLAAGRGRPETAAAIAAILAHLARHPLCRSPALGAFVAALME
jgi:hypothetical protein